MAFYAIVGDGIGNDTEILQSLEDLKEKAAEDEVDFWFGIIAKISPNDTEKAILDWFRKEEVWFEVVGVAPVDALPLMGGGIYGGAQEYHTGKSAEALSLALLEKAQNAGEESSLLALFVNSDDDSPLDSDLMAVVEKADGVYPIHLLNGQMVLLSLEEDDDEDEPGVDGEEIVEEEEPESAEDVVEVPVTFTREELTKMSVAELGGLAKGQGIDAKGLGKRDLVAALLGEEAIPAAAKPVKAAKKAAPQAAASEEEATVEAIEEAIAESVLGNGEAMVIVIYQGRVTTSIMNGARAMAMVL